jgi:hypothetical protein
MKTFLHYTKERELDEWSIPGALGSLTRVGSNINKGANWFKSKVAPAFAAGAKPGSTLSAVGDVASDITSAAEKKRHAQRQHAYSADVDQIAAAHRALPRNHADIVQHQTNLASIKNTYRGKPEEASRTAEKYVNAYAEVIRNHQSNTSNRTRPVPGPGTWKKP